MTDYHLPLFGSSCGCRHKNVVVLAPCRRRNGIKLEHLAFAGPNGADHRRRDKNVVPWTHRMSHIACPDFAMPLQDEEGFFTDPVMAPRACTARIQLE